MQQSESPDIRPLRYPNVWRGVSCLMLLAVLVSMMVPTPQIDVPVDFADKWVHVLAFAALAAWAAQIYTPSPTLWRVGWGLVLFGAATELLQALIPWRSGDVMDFLADAVGVGIGLTVALTPLGRGLQMLEKSIGAPKS